jgi:hypothetical protein
MHVSSIVDPSTIIRIDRIPLALFTANFYFVSATVPMLSIRKSE